MANRFPLIFNSGAGQIQELAASDNLDLTSSNLVNAGILFTSSGSATAPSLQIGSGTTYNPGLYSPGTDQVAVSTNGVERLRLSSTGEFMFKGAGTTPGTDKAVSFNGSAPVNSMVLDSSGRLGIGTSAPGSALHVVGTSLFNGTQSAVCNSTTGSYMTFQHNGTSVGDIGTGNHIISGGATTDFSLAPRSTGSLVFGAGGAERARITSAGLVGIGTSLPDSTLHIETTSNRVMRASSSDTGATNSLLISNGSNYNYGVLGNVSGTTLIGGDVYGLGYTASSGTDFTPVLSWTANTGRVGIGTTSPSTALQVVGTGRFGDGTNGTVNLLSASGNQNYVDSLNNAANAFQEIQFRATNLRFMTAASGTPQESARIDSSGRLLVGTPTLLPGVASSLIQASNSLADYVIASRNTNATPYGQYIVYGSSPNNTDSHFFVCSDSTAARFTVRSNGGITNFQANDVNLSDINSKKDISPATGTWDCIKEWEIVNYHYKDQPDDADFNLGVIAQQIVEICPEVVAIFEPAKDATLSVLDEEGNEVDPAQEAQPEKLGVKEQQMYWMAIKTLQESQVRIEQLESKVAALEGA